MKLSLIILFSFCLLFNKVYAQSPTATLDSLVKFKVITSKQRTAFVQAIKTNRRDAPYRITILYELQDIMLRKIFHVDPRKTGLSYGFSKDYLLNKNRDSIKSSLNLLLDKIKRADLITNRIYASVQKDIDSSRYVADIQLIAGLGEMSLRLEWLTPNRLMPVAEDLHKNGIVSDSAFSRLTEDIRSSKIESSSQLAGYCRLTKTFNLKKYPDDPNLWLEQLHNDIASTLPGLDFTNFGYSTSSVSSPENLSETKFNISLTCNGQVYKYSAKAIILNNNSQVPPTDLMTRFFHRIFNKILADQRSPLRLHNIMFNGPGAADDSYKQLTVTALNAEQAHVFMRAPCMLYMLTSMDDYGTDITSARLDSTIAGLKTAGVFAHLPEAAIDSAIEKAKADDWFSMNRLLANFPQVIYPLDSILMGPDEPYVSLLKRLGKITHGAFSPTGISQKKIKGGITLQYSFKGKIHIQFFKTTDGWIGDQLSPYLDRLSPENGLAGKFYQLEYGDIIYLTSQQYSYILKHKLLDFEKRKPAKAN
jgi:hypothetical protein